jgi:hypothetical protein
MGETKREESGTSFLSCGLGDNEEKLREICLRTSICNVYPLEMKDECF